MRARVIPAALALLFALSGCDARPQQDGQDVGAFFLWMDGYIAQQTDQPYPLLLNFYCEKGYDIGLLSQQITEVWAEDQPSATISLDKIEELTTNSSDEYEVYSVYVSVAFEQEGTYFIDDLTFSLENGETIRLPIGEWTFEILDEAQGEPVLYNDIGATSAPDVYTFSASSLPPDIQLKELYYGEDQSVRFLKDSRNTGKIQMEHVTAPLYLVRPKITALVDGTETILLGTQCTCGALEVDEQDIQRSKEYTYQYLQDIAAAAE